jgi:hypothetical protein
VEDRCCELLVSVPQLLFFHEIHWDKASELQEDRYEQGVVGMAHIEAAEEEDKRYFYIQLEVVVLDKGCLDIQLVVVEAVDKKFGKGKEC